ncbi:MAG: tail fiber domain-containing protein [Bacteroidia bacterium]|nr:tail fiber domain-containing protein [Bacteroidia bacterium]
MKAITIFLFAVCLSALPVSAQDIEAKLSGATPSQGFTIKDNGGTNLFTLRGNGRLGMGTMNPVGSIHIEGTSGSFNALRVYTSTPDGWSGILLNQSGAGNAARFVINNTTSTNSCLEASTNGLGAAINANSSNASGKLLELMNSNTSRFLVETDGTVSMGGNLGIGTSSPYGRLDIQGTASANAIRITPWTSNGSGIYIKQDGSGNAARFDIAMSTSTNNCLEATTNASAPAIWANNTNTGVTARIFQANNGSSITRFFIECGGNVGIGVDDATQDLDVLNNARFRGVISSAYSAPLNLTSTGVLTMATSDMRLKTHITRLHGSLEKVMKLRGVRYNWKSDPDGDLRIGFIAQEVRDVVPEVVYTNPVDGFLGLNYAELTAVLAEAMQEQQLLINALQKRTDEVASLKQRVQELEQQYAQVRQLESDLNALKALLRERTGDTGAVQASLQMK